jgi:hypothetical protein
MAKGGLSFKAVGASLDTLAKRCHDLPKAAPSTFAFANSGVIQQAGRIVRERYIVPGSFIEYRGRKSGAYDYTEPPGATHGSISTKRFSKFGERFGRDARGRWGPLKDSDVAYTVTTERKLFVKGKFVSRNGTMQGFAEDLQSSEPEAKASRVIAQDYSIASLGKYNELRASIDADGRGVIELIGGYRAAEVGSRKQGSNGVRGWFRGLRTASSQWSKLLSKKYPGLLSLSGGVK